jgi:hypothetical protein
MLSRPVVGIAQSASSFNNCHRHFPELVEAVSAAAPGGWYKPVDEEDFLRQNCQVNAACILCVYDPPAKRSR